MKGAFPEELVWTAVLLITIVIITAIGIIALIGAFAFTGRAPLSTTIDFIAVTNRPYALAAVLTHFRPDDRNFLEHAVEISYSSLENASSQNLLSEVSDFLDEYDTNFFNVRITKDGKGVADISGRLGLVKGAQCSDKLEGFCVGTSALVTYPAGGPCGIGRIEIAEGKNVCPSLFSSAVCCKLDENEFKKQNPDIDVRHCGRNLEGVCNAMSQSFDARAGYIPIANCGEGTEDRSGESECKQFSSKMPVCCVYGHASRQRDIKSGFLSTAQIPLLYKNGLGYAEITIG